MIDHSLTTGPYHLGFLRLSPRIPCLCPRPADAPRHSGTGLLRALRADAPRALQRHGVFAAQRRNGEVEVLRGHAHPDHAIDSGRHGVLREPGVGAGSNAWGCAGRGANGGLGGGASGCRGLCDMGGYDDESDDKDSEAVMVMETGGGVVGSRRVRMRVEATWEETEEELRSRLIV